MKDFLLIVIILGVVGWGVWYYIEGNVAPPMERVVAEHVRYACEEGQRFKAYYDGDKVQVEFGGGRRVVTLSLVEGPGLGRRYSDEERSLILWVQGNEAVIQEDNVTTYKQCLPIPN